MNARSDCWQRGASECWQQRFRLAQPSSSSVAPNASSASLSFFDSIRYKV